MEGSNDNVIRELGRVQSEGVGFRLSRDQEDLIQSGHMYHVSEDGDRYCYLPFWYYGKPGEKWRVVKFEELPKFIKEDIGAGWVKGEVVKEGHPEDQLLVDAINDDISDMPDGLKDLVSDGYHTFRELYEFRKLYHALWVNAVCRTDRWGLVGNEIYIPFDTHKSWRHHDGDLCFGGGWFIVCSMLPGGEQVTNHYEAKDWDLFQIPESDKMKYEFDGHSATDVMERLTTLLKRDK